jgi:hypothetical protein
MKKPEAFELLFLARSAVRIVLLPVNLFILHMVVSADFCLFFFNKLVNGPFNSELFFVKRECNLHPDQAVSTAYCIIVGKRTSFTVLFMYPQLHLCEGHNC